MFNIIVLPTFSKSLASKFVSLNNQPCMIRAFLIGFNHVQLKYYPFMISLDKCNGSCSSINDLSMRSCIPSKSKDVNVNMVTNGNEAKTLVKHILCDCKCIFNSTTWNTNKKWNNGTCQYECKNFRTCKKDNIWNPGTCICENSKYLKCIVDTSATAYDELNMLWILYQQKWQIL